MQAVAVTAVARNRIERLRLDFAGAVQGVGFRPFVFRLACAEGLHGFVRNSGSGATVEVEGLASSVQRFLARLDAELPPPVRIHKRRAQSLAPHGTGQEFRVVPSTTEARPSALVIPDLATCAQCLEEVLDPADRRHAYAFTTCVHCGPRYSIVDALPYDRERTSMRGFRMCAACSEEYANPASRRFHAETIACPDCGPQLVLWDRGGREAAAGNKALLGAVAALQDGLILAVKSLGGYQLLADAANEDAVRRLRERKRRPRKPFATMFPSLASAMQAASISDIEQELLLSPEAPIVLVRANPGGPALAPNLAPGNPCLGIMLPYTPLHHLLLRQFDGPLVATSGNARDEPIATGNDEALERLGAIADLFLVHDRPILHAVDDSVVRVVAGRGIVLRRARGHAPLPIACHAVDRPLLALGGQQKNAVATAFDGNIFLGPHVGDLNSPRTRDACTRAATELPALHALEPAVVACDRHPDYFTSRLAAYCAGPVIRVQHHLAHVLSCMADNEVEAPVLGVAWDGTGWGDDGSIWGGEFLRVGDTGYRRFAHLQQFRLPGGDAAIREPRRAALGLLYAIFGARALEMTSLPTIAAFSRQELALLGGMLRRGVNAPVTSSAGRLFDAAASILDLAQISSFEGEAAMAVEFAADGSNFVLSLPPPVPVDQGGMLILDWQPMFAALIAERNAGASIPSLAAALHESLARAIVAVAERAALPRVMLSGGCFQNARLTQCAVNRLRGAGFEPNWHRRIPPNDGGLAAGQIVFAANPLIQETC
jgi:hydrogenase maturation protein HypF